MRFFILFMYALASSSCYLNANLSELGADTALSPAEASTPTLSGIITDGTHYNSAVNSTTMSWTAGTDPLGVLDHYELAIGTTPGGVDTLSWFDIGLVTSYQASGLILVDGVTYYPSLRLVNQAGNRSSSIAGDGWTVDIQLPNAPSSFLDGIMAFSMTDSPLLSWLAGSDLGSSGMSGYQVAIGTSLGGNQTMNWTSVGNVLTAALNALTFTGNQRYYASVRSLDIAGNVSAVIQGDGWWNFAQSKLAINSNSPAARWETENTNFGTSTALSEDGLTMVIGIPSASRDGNGSDFIQGTGAADVYIRSGGVWVFQQRLTATGTNARMSNDKFGTSVAISGNTIAVGANKQDYDETGANSLADAGAVYVYTRTAGVWSQQQKIVGTGANARVAGDDFGYAVGISSDTIVVGAQTQDYDVAGATSASDAGAAYVYTRTAGVWSQQQKLIATGLNARLINDRFGLRLAIDGETIVVASPLQSSDAAGGAYSVNAGAVFVYTRSGTVWSQQQKIVGTGVNGRIDLDAFGISVSISADTIAVGASSQDYDAAGANSISAGGAVYIYTRAAGVWSQQQKIVGTGLNSRVVNDGFGISVSLSADTLAVGAASQDYDAAGANLINAAGAAFVYTRSGTVWSQQQRIVASGVNARVDTDKFGISVAAKGDVLIAGATMQDYDATGSEFVSASGAAYTFLRTTGVWSQDQKIVNSVLPTQRTELANSALGSSVSISEDGLIMAVGAPGDDLDENGANYINNAGAVYVYIKSAGAWVLQQKIVATGVNARVASDGFGNSLAINGTTLVVGAKGQEYDSAGANLVNDAGAVYIYTLSAGVWSQQQKLSATGVNSRVAYDYFGNSVAISGDTVIVGAYAQIYDQNGANVVNGAGAAFIFTRTLGVWSQQQKIVASGVNARVAASDNFGAGVAIDGDTVAVSAPFQDYDDVGGSLLLNAGAVFVFTRTLGVWSQQQKIIATGANARVAGDQYGRSISIDTDTIAVGALAHSYDVAGGTFISQAGAAYIYTRTAGAWSQQQKIVATGTNARSANDSFGTSISVDADTLAIGSKSHGYDVNGANLVATAGAVYVYTRSSNVWSLQQKLVPTGSNNRIATDKFGTQVCISENGVADGYTVGVGVPDQTYNSAGADPVLGAGALFIYY